MLKVGPPVLVQWIGTLLKWSFIAAFAAGSAFFAWVILSGVFKHGPLGGLWTIVVFVGGVAAPSLLIGVMVRLLDRRKWPDFLR